MSFWVGGGGGCAFGPTSQIDCARQNERIREPNRSAIDGRRRQIKREPAKYTFYGRDRAAKREQG